MGAFEEWIDVISDGMSHREIAKRVGMTAATFHRKWTETAFDSDDAIAIARAFGRSPVEALVTLGSLTDAEVEKSGRERSLSGCTMLELSEEMTSRLRKAGEHPNGPDGR